MAAEHLVYHEQMHCEEELREHKCMVQLRQIRDNAWLAEQLGHTPVISQRSVLAACSLVALSQHSVPATEYIDTQCKVPSLGNAHYNIPEQSRWNPTTSVGYNNMESTTAILCLPVPEGCISALEHQVDVMACTMEKLFAVYYGQNNVPEPVVQMVSPVVSTSNNNISVPAETTVPMVNAESTSKKSKKIKKKDKAKKAKSSLLPVAQLEPRSFLGKLLSGGGGPPDNSSSSSSSSSVGSRRSDPNSVHGNDSNSLHDHCKGHHPCLKYES